MKFHAIFASLAGAATLAVVPALHAQILTITENPNTADAQVDDPNGGATEVNAGSIGAYVVRVGEQNAPGGAAYVMPFLLPTVAAGSQFTAASLQTQLLGITGTPTFNGDLYYLNRSPNTDPSPLAADYFQGAADTANTILQAAYYTPASPVRTDPNTGPFVTSNAAFSTALITLLNTVDPAGSTNAGKYFFLRINVDTPVIANGNVAYNPLTEDAGGANEKPILTLTTGPIASGIPEPSSVAVVALGAAGLIGLGIYRRKTV